MMRLVGLLVVSLTVHLLFSASAAHAVTCVDIYAMPVKDAPANALEICRQEATQGDRFAQEQVAAAYEFGMLGAARDLSEALKWARLAEAQGSTEVFGLLSTAYHDGSGTSVDLIEAIKFRILQVEHSNKRYKNESSLFGKDKTEQPMGRLRMMYDIRTLADWLIAVSDDAAVEAYTRADRWDEHFGFKAFQCLQGDTLCRPRKIRSN
jgi:TPR repeat protein